MRLWILWALLWNGIVIAKDLPKEGFFQTDVPGESYAVYVKGSRACVAEQHNGGYAIKDFKHSELAAGKINLKPDGNQVLTTYEDEDVKACLTQKGKFVVSHGQHAESPEVLKRE